MTKIFNVSAACSPRLHYMVNIDAKLEKIKHMIDRGQYFTINRARQYGKTTTLRALSRYLEKDYTVISLDFQRLSYADFENEQAFVAAFSREILDRFEGKEELPPEYLQNFHTLIHEVTGGGRLSALFRLLSKWCQASPRPIVLLIDEVDSATNNQVFLDFLAQLRAYYIDRDERATFQSVILAGVYDVKNLKRKFVTDDDHKLNSPWNIAADFLIDMSFSAKDIAGMLAQYEADHHTGMNIEKIAGLIYDYTSGYPFLVSRICKLLDERIAGSAAYPTLTAAWTRPGFLEAINILLSEKNTLFESLTGKLHDYPELKNVLHSLLFEGQSIMYNPDEPSIDMALMFGFVKVEKGSVLIANRIFETRLYNIFLTAPEVQSYDIYKAALQNKNQFIQNGRLNMKLVLEKFVEHFDDVYGDQTQDFVEEDGRRYFLLYLRPIINGTGNYYIEARTRNMERTDVIVDYLGEQFIIELKIWRGNAYNERGETQLADYLNYYHLKKGYMLSFNFNKNKQIGVHEIHFDDKLLIEAVV